MKKEMDNEDNSPQFEPQHFKYYGKPFKINPQEHVLIVLCHNCHENHTFDEVHCDLVYNHRKQVHSIHLFNSTNKLIWIDNHRTLMNIYLQWPLIIYGSGRYINENDFFTNVIRNEETVKRIKKICIFCPTASHPIKICCNEKHKITRIARGWTFFCLCQPYSHVMFEFCSLSTGKLVPIKGLNPLVKYFIMYENYCPPSLLSLSLSSVVQHNLNTALDIKKNLVPRNICEQMPPCQQRHLTPYKLKPFNFQCTGYGIESSLISDW